MGKSPDASDDAPPLDEKLRLHLGDKLKLLFAETAQTPIPERFSALLDRLQQVGVEGVRAGEGQIVRQDGGQNGGQDGGQDGDRETGS